MNWSIKILGPSFYLSHLFLLVGQPESLEHLDEFLFTANWVPVVETDNIKKGIIKPTKDSNLLEQDINETRVYHSYYIISSNNSTIQSSPG